MAIVQASILQLRAWGSETLNPQPAILGDGSLSTVLL